MANRYQNQPYPAADDYGRDAGSRSRPEGDPLAELARLIGQTDPFAASHREPPRRPEPQQAYREQASYEQAYQDEPEDVAEPAPHVPPPWMQRVAAHEAQQHQVYEAEHRAQSYELPSAPAEQDHYQPQDYASEPDYHPEAHQQHDPNRYDEALYGHAEDQHAPYAQDDQYQYADDPYAYQDGYAEQEEAPKRRGGLKTVAAILALAVVGTGGAFAYRTFVGSSRSGEPPIIRAEPGPNKIIPPSATASNDSGKSLDRVGSGGPERMVPREEQPVNVQDATKAGGPRVVFPPLNQNANPPTTASVSPANKPMVGNGAMQPGDEPRKIKTFTVRGDDPDATPAARQAPARLTTGPAAPAPPAAAPAPRQAASSNAPMSLTPQSLAPAAPATARVASLPAQQAAPVASGGYVVQVSSQRSEGDAQASFRALQGKYPSVLGSRTPLIKRADLGDKGVYYRAMVGPFGNSEEAAQLCSSLKTAGGNCVVQRN